MSENNPNAYALCIVKTLAYFSYLQHTSKSSMCMYICVYVILMLRPRLRPTLRQKLIIMPMPKFRLRLTPLLKQFLMIRPILRSKLRLKLRLKLKLIPILMLMHWGKAGFHLA